MLDMQEAVINWGDGSVNTVIDFTGGERSFSATHQYLNDERDGQYTISVTAADDDGGISDVAEQTINVLDVGPVVASVKLSHATIHEDSNVTVSDVASLGQGSGIGDGNDSGLRGIAGSPMRGPGVRDFSFLRCLVIRFKTHFQLGQLRG